MKDTRKLKSKFIEKCKERLNKSGKSTKDITKAAYISQSTVDDFFNNRSNAKVETVIRILNALNCELRLQ